MFSQARPEGPAPQINSLVHWLAKQETEENEWRLESFFFLYFCFSFKVSERVKEKSAGLSVL